MDLQTGFGWVGRWGDGKATREIEMRTVGGVGKPNSLVGKEMRQRDNDLLGD